jgi:hypothetical protein
MRPDGIVFACVRLQNLAPMHLTQDNDVVYTLTPDRSDQPFGKAILPRRGWCCGLVRDAHRAPQSARDNVGKVSSASSSGSIKSLSDSL